MNFEENSCKAFHGGLTDLKYVPKVVKHICHPEGETHEPRLVEMYSLYTPFLFYNNIEAETCEILRIF